jgi:RNA polymerase primary sigma factor
MSLEDKKNEYIEQITKAIPADFPDRDFIVSLSKMDTRHFENPVFSCPAKLAILMSTKPPFTIEFLDSAWNKALCDSNYEYSAIAKKLVLSRKEEKDSFLQFNYCRSRVGLMLKEARQDNFTLAQAQECVRWGREMKRCRDTLVIANLGLVFSMGRKYNIFVGTDISELVTEGFGAIMRAVDGFDVDRGFKFSTYACRSIIQAMNRIKAKTSKRLQREFPSSLDITPESKITEVDQSKEEDLCELRSVLEYNKAELSENERLVIAERYLNGGSKKTLEDVGLVLGLTKERVRQIQNKALEKLKNYMVN